jgi:FtsH-binding integral membrane protein
MSLCKDMKRFTRTHEIVADLFSLLGAGLLFASVWATLEYHQLVLQWLAEDYVMRAPMLLLALAINAFGILALLAAGSSRFGEDDERCFGTFPGRRTRHGATGLFSSWVQHMENVGKKHR